MRALEVSNWLNGETALTQEFMKSDWSDNREPRFPNTNVKQGTVKDSFSRNRERNFADTVVLINKFLYYDRE